MLLATKPPEKVVSHMHDSEKLLDGTFRARQLPHCTEVATPPPGDLHEVPFIPK